MRVLETRAPEVGKSEAIASEVGNLEAKRRSVGSGLSVKNEKSATKEELMGDSSKSKELVVGDNEEIESLAEGGVMLFSMLVHNAREKIKNIVFFIDNLKVKKIAKRNILSRYSI